ncbi:MAG: S80 family phage morphogenetic serine protease [Candidatus Dojkabacteria bacterium]
MKKNSEVIAYILHEESMPSHSSNLLKNNSDSVIFEAYLQDFLKNRNKRVYSREVLEDALNSPHIVEMKKNRSWVGEAGHPMDKSLQRQLWIAHSNVSHIILETSIEGEKVKALIESAMSPMGFMMRDSIRQGMRVAFSMRGVAPITKNANGYVEVKKPLKIATYDWVFFPSHEIAYQQKVLREDFNPTFEVFPITEDALLDFMKNDSENVATILEGMDINLDNSKVGLSIVSPSVMRLVIEETNSGETFLINLEKYMQRKKIMKEIIG